MLGCHGAWGPLDAWSELRGRCGRDRSARISCVPASRGGSGGRPESHPRVVRAGAGPSAHLRRIRSVAPRCLRPWRRHVAAQRRRSRGPGVQGRFVRRRLSLPLGRSRQRAGHGPPVDPPGAAGLAAAAGAAFRHRLCRFRTAVASACAGRSIRRSSWRPCRPAHRPRLLARGFAAKRTDRRRVAVDIGRSYSARAAYGRRISDRYYLGPEIAAFAAGGNYRQIRAGLHVTGMRTNLFEWSGAAGYASDTDRRSGLYGRLGVLMRK